MVKNKTFGKKIKKSLVQNTKFGPKYKVWSKIKSLVKKILFFYKTPKIVGADEAAVSECTILNGKNGTVANSRSVCLYDGGCYNPNSNQCWKLETECKSIKVKFLKFIVEEHLSIRVANFSTNKHSFCHFQNYVCNDAVF